MKLALRLLCLTLGVAAAIHTFELMNLATRVVAEASTLSPGARLP